MEAWGVAFSRTRRYLIDPQENFERVGRCVSRTPSRRLDKLPRRTSCQGSFTCQLSLIIFWRDESHRRRVGDGEPRLPQDQARRGRCRLQGLGHSAPWLAQHPGKLLYWQDCATWTVEHRKIVPHSASQVKNLHVLRHMGLQDLRLVIQVIYNRISSYNNRNKSKGKPWIENKDNRLMKN